jgi:aspartokinase-like uncharacterized kinase
MAPPEGPVVVKVGGSLYDLPDLGPRLRRWLTTCNTSNILLVPGGGSTADVIRHLDQVHRLGEEEAHWLALRALTLNAHLLQRLLPEAVVIGGSAQELRRRDRPRWAIVDAHAFAVEDESQPGHLPHVWDATSDAVAARVAVVSGARRLVLLKSISLPEGMDWDTAAREELVDGVFASLIEVPDVVGEVWLVNLREEGR